MNFLRCCILDFAKTTKYIVNMMSEKVVFKWTEAGKRAFEEIKMAIVHAPTLVNSNFSKDFIIYCYASEHTMSGILVQKSHNNEEVPISFMSVPLKKHELKYLQTKKKAYAVVKATKQFRYYILHSHATVFVPNSAVKSVLTQQDVGINNRVSWVSKIPEFNLDIKPTKMVRGKDLCKLMAENKFEEEKNMPLTLFVGHRDSWFTNVSFYLTYGDCSDHLSSREKHNLRSKVVKYIIFDDILYKKGLDGTFLRCVDKPYQEALLKTFHSEACGGHFSSTVTAYKILRNC